LHHVGFTVLKKKKKKKKKKKTVVTDITRQIVPARPSGKGGIVGM
jgi:hypothetical protein